ncbi:hypothetical protein BJ166DRAFT_499953 [Pestalotiopsis sp. NC0098]|nr:hypothetical protein BJ166DRAFT_499953 [Pestalotiopsis sp. NC0098]
MALGPFVSPAPITLDYSQPSSSFLQSPYCNPHNLPRPASQHPLILPSYLEYENRHSPIFVTTMELLRKQTIAEAFASVIRDAYQNNPDAVHAHIERSMMRDSDSINPGVREGRTIGQHYDATCTCSKSIMNCEVCFAGKVSQGTDRMEHTLQVKGPLNKFGDVPNPANQQKAARRRRNRELRLEDPAVYREVMAAKKAHRDEELRAKGQ